MKQTTISIFLILFSITMVYSQTETQNPGSTTVVIEKDYLNGLHKPTVEEKGNLRLELTPDLSFFTEAGKKISFNEVLPLLQSGDYTLDPYIDDKQELKAAILRYSTEEEKKEMKEMQAKMNKSGEYVGKQAKPFFVTDLNENKYSLEELKGKTIVMNFWFIECKPCVMEMPDLNELVEKYKGKEVVFLGFATNNKEALNSFLVKKEFTYNIIPDSKEVITAYGVNSFPTHIVIDKNSRITYFASGLSPTSISNLEKEIETLLKK